MTLIIPQAAPTDMARMSVERQLREHIAWRPHLTVTGRRHMATRSSADSSFMRLGALDAQSGDVNVIIETPKGSRNKFKYEVEQHLFKLSGVLPAGAVFPFDFGFIPATMGG